MLDKDKLKFETKAVIKFYKDSFIRKIKKILKPRSLLIVLAIYILVFYNSMKIPLFIMFVLIYTYLEIKSLVKSGHHIRHYRDTTWRKKGKV